MSFYGLENPNPTTQQYAFPRRGIHGKLSGTCIVHTAEMYGARNTCAFISRRSDYGGYHTVVDHQEIIEYLPYEYEAWQDSETNNWAVGISAACKAADWRGMSTDVREGYYRNLAKAGADFVLYMLVAYGIDVPRRRLNGAEARARKPGFCAHGDSGIHRTDPGKDFDWNLFFKYIDEELEGEDEVAGFHAEEDWYKAMIQAQARLDKRTDFVKGSNSDTVYDTRGGIPRGLKKPEWVVLSDAGHRVEVIDQAKLDAWIADYNERNPS